MLYDTSENIVSIREVPNTCNPFAIMFSIHLIIELSLIAMFSWFLLLRFQRRLLQMGCTSVRFNPFPHTRNLQQMTLKHLGKSVVNLYKLRYYNWKKYWKHCGKRWNRSFWEFCLDALKRQLRQMHQNSLQVGKG